MPFAGVQFTVIKGVADIAGTALLDLVRRAADSISVETLEQTFNAFAVHDGRQVAQSNIFSIITQGGHEFDQNELRFLIEAIEAEVREYARRGPVAALFHPKVRALSGQIFDAAGAVVAAWAAGPPGANAIPVNLLDSLCPTLLVQQPDGGYAVACARTG